MENIIIYKLFILLSYILNQSLISSYINLPVHTYHSVAPKPDETSKKVYYDYFHDNNIYTLVELGWPSQKMVAKLNFDDYIFFIYYNRCNIESNFDLNVSITFKKTIFQRLMTDVYVLTYLVEDSFYFENKETFKMTYLFSPMDNDKSERQIVRAPYTCVDIGLQMGKPDSKIFNYNFIKELKTLNIINDYSFFIEYNPKNDDEGNLIIGVEPYNYNPEKYIYNQMVSIESSRKDYDLYWQLAMNEVYFNIKGENNEIKRINMTKLNVGLNHNLNIIIAPVEFMDYIEKGFFDKKNCRRNRLEKNFYNYDCASLEDIKDFPTIFFIHRTLRYTFEINYKDVFIEYNGRYMCKVWIDMSYRNNWRMGKPFLKKYFFSYNLDKKIISFYDMENKKEEKKENYIEVVYIIIIIILLFVIAGLSYVITRIFCKNKHHKTKANLLEDSIGISINDNDD